MTKKIWIHIKRIFYMVKNLKHIKYSYNLLEDSESKRIYIEILFGRATRMKKYFKQNYEKNQYYPIDLFSLSDSEVIVDAGAYNGDTLSDFITYTGGEFSEIHCFEPGKTQFVELEKISNTYAGKGRVFCECKGIYSKTGHVMFKMDNSSNDQIADNGDESIETIKIDDYFDDKPQPTLIKMDIEGAEIEAIKGATSTIKKSTPKLAICVYHHISHYWLIPAMIKTINPDYRIFIRHHSDWFHETVCYALPEKKRNSH